MARLDDANELCTEMDRVLEQLARREANVAGTIKKANELRSKLGRVRTDNEHFYRLKAGGAKL